MLEIWTGLQLLTTSLAPIQEPCSTSFFSSHQEDEVRNASRPVSQLRPAANRGYERGLLAGLDSFFCCLLCAGLQEQQRFTVKLLGESFVARNFHSEIYHIHLAKLQQTAFTVVFWGDSSTNHLPLCWRCCDENQGASAASCPQTGPKDDKEATRDATVSSAAAKKG